MKAQPGTTYGTRFVFTGEDDEPGEGGNLYCLTRHFTDAQIKALPTTALELLPEPGAFYTWIVLSCALMLDSTDGAYTNLDAAAYLSVDDAPEYVPNDSQLGLTSCSDFLGVAGHQLVLLRKTFATEILGGGSPQPGLADLQLRAWGLRPQVVSSFTAAENLAVQLVMENEASGDLTGGNVQNSLLVRTLAMRVPSPTLWATLYPTL